MRSAILTFTLKSFDHTPLRGHLGNKNIPKANGLPVQSSSLSSPLSIFYQHLAHGRVVGRADTSVAKPQSRPV